MIRKFLVCGKQLFLASKKVEESGPRTPTVELLMPIKLFWDIQQILKQIDYSVASGEDPVLITELYRKVYTKVAKYAVTEKDRVFLYEKILSGGS